MQFSWTVFREYITNLWSKLNTPQKIVLVAAPLFVATALIFLITWANTPEYVPIFTKLSDAEAGAIKKKLQDLKVDYKLQDNGATILVPKQQAAEIRLDLANSGLPAQSKFSFDNLNDIHLGETDADRKLRYILGLQNELETTLKTLSGVQDARVHITIPEPSLFTESQKEPTAAVTLKLSPAAKIQEDQIKAVANLLASSVEGLQPEKVTIVDTDGNVLSDLINNKNDQKRLSTTQIQMQQTVEDKMEKSVQSMLDKAIGPGKAIVRANVLLDFDQIKIVTQKKGPGALVSKQTMTETATNTPDQSVSNVQNGIQGYVTPSTSNNVYVAKSQSTENYEIDNTQEERMVSPGNIKRLSVSVLADAASVKPDQLENIKAVVASAVGFDAARGDQIQVAVIPFDKTEEIQAKEVMAEELKNKRIMTYAKLGAAVLIALLFLIGIWLTNRKRYESNEVFAFDPVNIASKEFESTYENVQAQKEAAASDLESKNEVADEMEKMKRTIEGFAKHNPEEVAKIIKTWLMEEK